MNKNVLIIGGSIAILGVGAYLYFKGKAKPNEETIGGETTGTGTTGTGSVNTGTDSTGTSGGATSSGGSTTVPPTGTVLTTPEQVVDTAKKIAEAKSLATQISDLRIKRESFLKMSLNEYKKFYSNRTFWNDTQAQVSKDVEIKNLLKGIQNLDEQLGKLGFMEVNGSITKIA